MLCESVAWDHPGPPEAEWRGPVRYTAARKGSVMPSQEHDRLVAMVRARRAAATGGDGGTARSGVEVIRAFMDTGTGFFTHPDDVALEPVDAGGAAAEWIVADGADSRRVILYFHGGVYVGGSIASHRDLCARLSRAAGARVLSVDYRLCPEHPLAAGLEDAVAVYRWLTAQGVASGNVVFGGDSSGGGLTLRALVALRDAGDVLPAGVFTISAWTDLTASGGSYAACRTTDVLFGRGEDESSSGGGLVGGSMEALLGEDNLGAPEKSPLFADLRNLPPLLLLVSGVEMLLDDSRRVAAQAEAAGVHVTLEVSDGMIHIWPWFARLLPEGRDTIERIGAFVRARAAAA